MIYGGNIARATKRKASVLRAPNHRLEVTWFNGWHPALNEALQSLPENDACPHELFRLLIQTSSSAPKRVALISKRGVPIAVAGLRQIGPLSWEPVTTWIIPGVVFPARSGYLIPELEALKVDLRLAWWRIDSPPSPGQWMRSLKRTPTRGIRCADDLELYWRKSGHLNTVRQCRKRCRDFTLTINAPGAAEWTIRHWGERWGSHPDGVTDRIVNARYLENRGRYYSFLLLDADKPVVGHGFSLHRRDLVWRATYRDRAYDRIGVGTDLLDLAFHWAAEAGLEKIDLDVASHSKTRWAPQDGQVLEFVTCPEHLWLPNRLTGLCAIPGRPQAPRSVFKCATSSEMYKDEIVYNRRLSRITAGN
jgi:GNAT superfamily N-acetyltransferase